MVLSRFKSELKSRLIDKLTPVNQNPNEMEEIVCESSNTIDIQNKDRIEKEKLAHEKIMS
jgi:hypothetical protein